MNNMGQPRCVLKKNAIWRLDFGSWADWAQLFNEVKQSHRHACNSKTLISYIISLSRCEANRETRSQISRWRFVFLWNPNFSLCFDFLLLGLIMYAHNLFCSSTLRIPPLVVRRSWRSMMTWSCNFIFTILIFHYLCS